MGTRSRSISLLEPLEAVVPAIRAAHQQYQHYRRSISSIWQYQQYQQYQPYQSAGAADLPRAKWELLYMMATRKDMRVLLLMLSPG